MNVDAKKVGDLRVCGLIVVFNPSVNVLQEVLSTLAQNVLKIFLFDNSGHNSVIKNCKFNIEVPLEIFSGFDNVGIATAQNFILNAALKEGFDFAVMSDQDTIYPVDYVTSMSKYCHVRNNVAALFPGWLDINLQGDAIYPGQYIFDSRNKMRIDFIESEFIEISHGISSGMMINLFNLRQVGLMKDNLFIDWVDNEWCWRARSAGFVLLAIPGIKIQHTLGNCTVKIFGRNFVKRGLERNYYIIRNALYLIFYSRIPSAAKFYLVKKAIHHTVFSLIASNDRLAELCSLAKAWLHGLQARLGKFS